MSRLSPRRESPIKSKTQSNDDESAANSFYVMRDRWHRTIMKSPLLNGADARAARVLLDFVNREEFDKHGWLRAWPSLETLDRNIGQGSAKRSMVRLAQIGIIKIAPGGNGPRDTTSRFFDPEWLEAVEDHLEQIGDLEAWPDKRLQKKWGALGPLPDPLPETGKSPSGPKAPHLRGDDTPHLGRKSGARTPPKPTDSTPLSENPLTSRGPEDLHLGGSEKSAEVKPPAVKCSGTSAIEDNFKKLFGLVKLEFPDNEDDRKSAWNAYQKAIKENVAPKTIYSGYMKFAARCHDKGVYAPMFLAKWLSFKGWTDPDIGLPKAFKRRAAKKVRASGNDDDHGLGSFLASHPPLPSLDDEEPIRHASDRQDHPRLKLRGSKATSDGPGIAQKPVSPLESHAPSPARHPRLELDQRSRLESRKPAQHQGDRDKARPDEGYERLRAKYNLPPLTEEFAWGEQEAAS